MTLSRFLHRLRAWWAGATPEQIAAVSDDELRKRLAIRNIRAWARGYGYDLDHLTDVEIMEHVEAVGRVVAQAGVTMEEAGRALKMNKQQGE